MSIASSLAGAQGAASGITNAVSRIASIFGLSPASFQSQVRKSSWRGVPFITLSADSRFGRRKAVHEYPYRDLPWIEDMGQATRRFNVSGFLVGDDVIAQRDALIEAIEKTGPGQLIHGTFGAKTVDLLDSSFVEKWDGWRYFEVTLSFAEGGQRIYPTVTASTGAAVAAAAASANAAAATSFLATALNALKSGAAVIGMAVSTVLSVIGTVKTLVADATTIFHCVAALESFPGQFFGALASALNMGSSQGVPAAIARGPNITSSTTQSLGALATVSRNAVTLAASNLESMAAQLGATSPSALASAAQSMAAALSASATDAGDAMRLLTSMANFTPTVATPASAVGAAMAAMQGAIGDLIRRAAVVELSIASSTYQPTSSDAAAAVRTSVCGLLNNEILIAGDQGEDGVFNALRVLLGAVVQDLTVRGAGLASMQTFNIGASLPAPVLALRIYSDPSRADELYIEAKPRHPAFMPSVFKALSQ